MRMIDYTESYWNKREKALDKKFNKSTNELMKLMKKEYQRVYKQVESEINAWYVKKMIWESKGVNQDFHYSELKELEQTQKAIELLIDELMNIEMRQLTSSLDDMYISTYQDMDKLTQQYFQQLEGVVGSSFHTESANLFHMEQTNRVASMSMIEERLRREVDMAHLSQKIWDDEQILKHGLDWYGEGFGGDKFNHRIERRRAIVKHQINEALKNAMIKGSSVDKCTKDIMERLNVSYSSAKRLAHNELTYAQHCASSKEMKNNGFNYVKRKTVKDSKVCPICKKHEGEVIPIDTYEKNPSVGILHVNCRDFFCPILIMEQAELVK